MGLMGRPALSAGDGLWLPASNGIHMMFMRFPIDAVFVSKPDAGGERVVKSVHRGLRAWTGLVPLVPGVGAALVRSAPSGFPLGGSAVPSRNAFPLRVAGVAPRWASGATSGPPS